MLELGRWVHAVRCSIYGKRLSTLRLSKIYTKHRNYVDNEAFVSRHASRPYFLFHRRWLQSQLIVKSSPRVVILFSCCIINSYVQRISARPQRRRRFTSFRPALNTSAVCDQWTIVQCLWPFPVVGNSTSRDAGVGNGRWSGVASWVISLMTELWCFWGWYCYKHWAQYYRHSLLPSLRRDCLKYRVNWNQHRIKDSQYFFTARLSSLSSHMIINSTPVNKSHAPDFSVPRCAVATRQLLLN